jgi:ATP-binding cassette subfamily F protein 3
LDEPTNHLDVDAREALIQALNEFGGAVVVVSHDRHLLGLLADRLILIDGGTAREFDGSLDDYRDLVLASAAGKDKGERPAKRNNSKDGRRKSSETRALRKAAMQAEAELKQLWQRREEIDKRLSAPSSNSGVSASELMKARAEIERRLEAAEHNWLEAGDAAERGSGTPGAT